MPECAVHGCENSTRTGTCPYCEAHYMQIRRHGHLLERTTYTPNDVEIVKARRGKEGYREGHARITIRNRKQNIVGLALVDLDDLEKVKQHKWSRHRMGYAVARIGDKVVLMHRFIMGSDKAEYDHRDGNQMNNRKKNLRPCDRFGNNQNVGCKKNNKLGVKGVYWDKARKKYAATIMAQGKAHFLGRFTELEDAVTAYNEAAERLHGDFANTG